MSKKYFEPHYKVFSNNTNYVKVGCSYAGKMYYGVAKCAPEDKFDYNFGYRLAKARCDYAICYAKMKRSQDKIDFYRHYAEKFQVLLESEIKYEHKLHVNYLSAFEDLALVSKE